MSSRTWLVALIVVLILVYQVAPLLPVAPSLPELFVHLKTFVEAIVAHVVVDKSRIFLERWRNSRRSLLILARELVRRDFPALRKEIRRSLRPGAGGQGGIVGGQISADIMADATIPRHHRAKLLAAVERARQQISSYIDKIRLAGLRNDAVVELAAYKFRDIVLNRIEDALSQRDSMASILPLRNALDTEANQRKLRRYIQGLCDNVRRGRRRSTPAFVRSLKEEARRLYPDIPKETLDILIDGAAEETTAFISKNIRGRRGHPMDVVELGLLHFRDRLLTTFEDYHASTSI